MVWSNGYVEYRDIIGTRYKISVSGNIINDRGMARRTYSSRIGYVHIKLCINGKMKTCSAHRLLWEAWVAPIPPGLWVKHKNGIKNDNRLDNLEITTPSENHKRAFRELGRISGAKGKGKAASQIPLIKEMLRCGISQRKIAKKLGVSQPAICALLKRCRADKSLILES